MRLGVTRETFAGERRVALIPADLPKLIKRGVEVSVQKEAGLAAGYPDSDYAAKGAKIEASRQAVCEAADVLAWIRAAGANPDNVADDFALLSSRHVLLAMLNPLGQPEHNEPLAKTGATTFALELVPRITRAQSMDVLSSMANLAGYRAVLLAATQVTKIFPMMMTAAGTLSPAKVFVLGAGVAGLQAIATAKRLGANVEAYDVRPEVEEQVQSVGGKFVKLDLETEGAGDAGGYAKAQSKEFYARQQEQLAQYIRAADVVITTAAIPGRKAPVLITESMMEGMRQGAAIVDLAAETGGNCAVTKAGETIERDGVSIMGPVNVASDMAFHASQMFSRNVVNFLELITDKEGNLNIDTDDEVVAGTLLTRDGKVVHPRCVAADAEQKQATS